MWSHQHFSTHHSILTFTPSIIISWKTKQPEQALRTPIYSLLFILQIDFVENYKENMEFLKTVVSEVLPPLRDVKNDVISLEAKGSFPIRRNGRFIGLQFGYKTTHTSVQLHQWPFLLTGNHTVINDIQISLQTIHFKIHW